MNKKALPFYTDGKTGVALKVAMISCILMIMMSVTAIGVCLAFSPLRRNVGRSASTSDPPQRRMKTVLAAWTIQPRPTNSPFALVGRTWYDEHNPTARRTVYDYDPPLDYALADWQAEIFTDYFSDEFINDIIASSDSLSNLGVDRDVSDGGSSMNNTLTTTATNNKDRRKDSTGSAARRVLGRAANWAIDRLRGSLLSA